MDGEVCPSRACHISKSLLDTEQDSKKEEIVHEIDLYVEMKTYKLFFFFTNPLYPPTAEVLKKAKIRIKGYETIQVLGQFRNGY